MKKQINLKKLKKSEKAVLIAKDVLKWIKSKRIVVSPGTYVKFPVNLNTRVGEQLQDVLPEVVTPEEPCTVCALGACFLASVARFNALEIPKVGTKDWLLYPYETKLYFTPLQDHLHQAFSDEQLILIESAFEGRRMGAEHENLNQVKVEVSIKKGDKAVAFGEQRRFREPSTWGAYRINSEKVLTAICRNIIRNDGLFKP